MQGRVAHLWGMQCLFYQASEPRAWGLPLPVEPKNEFIEGAIQVFDTDDPRVGAQQPQSKRMFNLTHEWSPHAGKVLEATEP